MVGRPSSFFLILEFIKILLVDEPTGQLDQETGDSIVKLVRKIAKENRITVILVTHDNELAKKCSEVYALKDYRLIKE